MTPENAAPPRPLKEQMQEVFKREETLYAQIFPGLMESLLKEAEERGRIAAQAEGNLTQEQFQTAWQEAVKQHTGDELNYLAACMLRLPGQSRVTFVPRLMNAISNLTSAYNSHNENIDTHVLLALADVLALAATRKIDLKTRVSDMLELAGITWPTIPITGGKLDAEKAGATGPAS